MNGNYHSQYPMNNDEEFRQHRNWFTTISNKWLGLSRENERIQDINRERNIALNEEKRRQENQLREREVRRVEREQREEERERERVRETEHRRELMEMRQKEKDREWRREQNKINEYKVLFEERRQDYLELIENNNRFQKQTKADLKSKNAKGDTEKVPTKVINSYKDLYEHLDELYKIELRKNEMLRANQTGLGGNLPSQNASLPQDMHSTPASLYPNLHREQTGQQHGEIGAQDSGPVHSAVHNLERARTRSQNCDCGKNSNSNKSDE